MLFRAGRAAVAPARVTSAWLAAHRPALRRTIGRPQPPAHVIAARVHLLGLFGLLGFTVSSWLARLPTVRDQLGLTSSELGAVMLTGALGSLLTVLVAGAVVARIGARRALTAAAVLFSVAYLLLGLGPATGRTSLLVVGIVAMSASFALGNVPLNIETVAVERAMGRTVVPQFHAAFSIGAVLGSGVGALAAWAGVPVVVQFSVVSLAAIAWRLHSIPHAVLTVHPAPAPAPAPGTGPGAARPRGGLRAGLAAWRERRTLLIGVVVMAAALSEGSANNWLAIAVVDGFAATEAVAAAVFGVFVASMTASRLLGTYLIDRFGRHGVLVASGSASVAGLSVFALGPSLPFAVAGVVFWGMGAGLIIPIGMAAVSADPLRAAGRVSVTSAFASIASMTAPPLIGIAAEAMGARHALLLITVVMMLGVLVSGAIKEPSAEPAPTAAEPAPTAADVPVQRAPVEALASRSGR